MELASFPKYKLRWRFDFASRPSKYGAWSRPGNTKDLQAWCQNKEGLVIAAIEGKDCFTNEEKRLVECSGSDFCNFQWMAVSFMECGPMKDYTPPTKLIGLKIVTRDKFIEVFTNGETHVKTRPEEDKKFHYETYGK